MRRFLDFLEKNELKWGISEKMVSFDLLDFDYLSHIFFVKTSFRQSISFQKDGVKFLENNEAMHLADDMGLGKTIQTIAALSNLFLKIIYNLIMDFLS